MQFEVAPRYEPEPEDVAPAMFDVGDAVVVRSDRVVTVKRVLPPNECRNFWLYDVGEPSLYAESELVPAIPVVQAFDGPPPPRIPELRRAPATVKDGNPKDSVGAEEARVTDPTTGGQKGVKLERFDLIPFDALEEVARVYGYGARKYAEHNWARGYAWSLTLGALLRHVSRFMCGEDRDPETGCLHLAHAAWHCLTLIAFVHRGLGTDDRVFAGRCP